MTLSKEQKDVLSEYLSGISKITFTGLVLAKFIDPDKIAAWDFAGGSVLTLVSLLMALFLKKGE